jgi:DNA-binding response OmpR family regulator
MPRPLILAVEDEQAVRVLMSQSLPLFGLDVLTATCGSEAIQLYRVRWQEIAAVLLDEGLPDMSGLDVFMELREVNPTVRACFVTGWGSSSPEGRLSKFQVVRKPFGIADLADTLHTLLR